MFDDVWMEWTFTGEVIEWRGPAPYLFVAMTPEESEDLKEAARGLIYWGQVPVHVTIGDTEFTTALFPRDGRYLVPGMSGWAGRAASVLSGYGQSCVCARTRAIPAR